MQFITSSIVAGSLLVTLASAQSSSVAVNNVPTSFTAGQAGTFNVVAGPGPYTLQLRRGNSMNLSNVTYIDCAATQSVYSWTPTSSIESGTDYAIEIIQNGQINYSGMFSIVGGAAPGNAPSQLPSPEGCPSTGATLSSSSVSASASATGYGSATTMSTAARTGINNCAVTVISDGQPQAPTGCTPSTPAATSAAYTPPSAPKVSSVPGYNYGAVGTPYAPMPGATGSPAASNSTMPTYSVPSSPTGSSSGSSGGSAPKGSAAPKSGAAQYGSSFALIAGAAAAFAFLN